MVRYLRLSLLLFPLFLMSAVPDDISTNQRAWYDAVDIDADGDYTDNQSGDSAIGTWRDKSGQGNHVSSAGGNRPTYRTSNPSSQRSGVEFDGSDDYLKDDDDIWNGSVTHSEIFLVTKVDNYTHPFIFSSMKDHNHRLSVHLPWGGDSSAGTSYFDHGQCCGDPARLSGSIPISTTTPYFWQFIGDGSTYQAIIQDAKVKLSDNNGVGAYNSGGGSTFSLGRKTHNGGDHYSGKIYEVIFYQQNLNNAQRRIMNAYLSAKWDKPFAATPTYVDVYAGDDSAYDFFVGGIGQEADGSQTIGTSQGLSITNNDFLANGKYVLAGVNYLTTTPQTGTEETGSLGDVSTTESYDYRASRLWFIDNTGTGGTVKLSFSASDIGIPTENGSEYGLLCRNGTTGDFAEVALSSMSSGVVAFDYLPTDDVCTIGKKKERLTLIKTSCVLTDGVNDATHAKRIPGATIRYALEVSNSRNTQVSNVLVEDTLTDQFDETSISNVQIDSANGCNCLNPVALEENGAYGGVDAQTVTLDFDTIEGSSKECGYFEVRLK